MVISLVRALDSRGNGAVEIEFADGWNRLASFGSKVCADQL